MQGIRGDTKMLNYSSILHEPRAKYILLVCLGWVLTTILDTYLPCFNSRMYLVLPEFKIKKQFSSQIDLHCGFPKRCL